jgi:hypothetical protein
MFSLCNASNNLARTPHLTPPAHSSINTVPIPVFFWHASPFTSVFGNIHYRIDKLLVVHSYVPSLLWQVRLYHFILRLAYFHVLILPLFLYLTRL